MNNEKKKTAVVACLFAVIVCVGGFQFLGKKGGTIPPAKKDKKAADAAAADTGPKNPQVANNLPTRDPFEIPADQLPPDPTAKKPVVTAPTINTLTAFKPHGRRAGNGGFSPLAGPLPPASLNAAEINKINNPSSGYRMVGSIRGLHPAAVIADASGKQRLVPVGGAIDGDSTLESVSDNSVCIVCRGKRLRLSMGGNPIEK